MDRTAQKCILVVNVTWVHQAESGGPTKKTGGPKFFNQKTEPEDQKNEVV